MAMKYNELLSKPWTEIERKKRTKALRYSYQAGFNAAELGLIGSGGSALVYDLDRIEGFFFKYVVKEEEFQQGSDFDDQMYWENLPPDEFCNEPRVVYFCSGWRRFMAEEEWQREKYHIRELIFLATIFDPLKLDELLKYKARVSRPIIYGTERWKAATGLSGHA
jgi:hypothetical protein